MKTETVKITQVRVNAANPRTITDGKFQKLVDSLLALPKMLDLRPIVVDNTMTTLGGNMRYRALVAISEMTEEELRGRLLGIRDVQKMTKGEQEALTEYWLKWKDAGKISVVRASELTADEQRQFIIKDNASFGQWDYDMLANEWDSADINEWGVDVWSDNIKLDDFFSPNKASSKEEDKEGQYIEIIVSMPVEYANDKDDIVTKIKEALNTYDGIKVVLKR